MLSQKRGINLLVSRSVLIFLARLFPPLASTVVIVLFSHRLSQNDYGLYTGYWVQVNMLAPFICLGLHNLALTYPPAFLKRISGQLRPLHLLIFTLWAFGIGGVLMALQWSLFPSARWVPFAFLIVFSLGIVADALLVVAEQFFASIILNVIYASLFVAIHWLSIYTEHGNVWLFTALFWLSLFKLLASATVLSRPTKHVETTEGVAVSMDSFRSLWINLGLYDVIQLLSLWIDKFIVTILLTPNLAALYYNGTINIPFLPVLLGAASGAVLMQLAHHRSDESPRHTIWLMRATGRLLSSVVFPIFFFLLFNTGLLIAWLFGPEYHDAGPIFAASICVLPVRAYSFTTVLQLMHKGKLINAGAMAELVLAVLLMYPMYRWYGLAGMAFSFVISTYLQAAFYLYHSARLLNTTVFQLVPFRDWLQKFSICGVVFATSAYFITHYFAPKFVLILEGCVLGVVIATFLWAELKNERHHGYNEQQK